MKMKQFKTVGLTALLIAAYPVTVHADSKTSAGDSVVNIKVVSGKGSISSGSGFFIDNNLVMTASHVIHKQGTEYIRLFSKDYSYANASVAYDDTKNDIAILKVDTDSNKTFSKTIIPFKFIETPKDGEKLTIIGWPTEEIKHDNKPGTVYLLKYESVYSVSTGELKQQGETLVMSNAIKSGYSGGPVLNQKGNVVGMAWAHRPDTGESLAIPMDKLVNDLRDYYLNK
jgi:S1-C subfamily serine protease